MPTFDFWRWFSELADEQAMSLSKSISNLSDDEPLYDEVASDDDYSPIDTVKARENRERLEAEKAAKAAAVKAAAVAAGKEVNEVRKRTIEFSSFSG